MGLKLKILLTLTLMMVLTSPAWAVDRYKLNGDGTVTDQATGLTWIQDPSKIDALKAPMLWPQAVDACQNLSFGGQGAGAWRLPNINELKSIVEPDRGGTPKINTASFQCHNAPYWSSTPVLAQMSSAYTVEFTDGSLTSHPKLNLLNASRLYTRCVRK